MSKRIRKHIKRIATGEKPPLKEKLHTQIGRFPLNRAKTDRISFSVLRNEKDDIRKIENISYEIFVKNKWEWVVRYDDHGGIGILHRHIRMSLKNQVDIETQDRMKKYQNKNIQLTWGCNEIRREYLNFRKKFLKNSNLPLYP